jgi:hypothetical protein
MLAIRGPGERILHWRGDGTRNLGFRETIFLFFFKK